MTMIVPRTTPDTASPMALGMTSMLIPHAEPAPPPPPHRPPAPAPAPPPSISDIIESLDHALAASRRAFAVGDIQTFAVVFAEAAQAARRLDQIHRGAKPQDKPRLQQAVLRCLHPT